jgi:hypothetical protein
MFVPVACSQCGKPFQVPEAAVGKSASCPWCQAAVLALPVAGAAVAAKPQESSAPVAPPAARPEPLSLDDEPPAQSTLPKARRWLVILMLVLIAVVATGATMLVQRRHEGYFTSREWRAFTPSDGSCAVDLLGRPIEDADAPAANERRYTSRGWYSGTTTWLAWRNLTAVEAQLAATDDAWHNPQLIKLFDAERDRVKGIHGGYVAKDGTIKFKDPLTREVRLESPQGKAIVRSIVIGSGPRPRIYHLGIAGKRLDPDGDEVRRFFESFRAFD